MVAAWFLLSDAEHHLTSSMTGLLIAASQIIAAILDRFTGGERRLAFIVFFDLSREVGAARALAFTYVNPAVALLAGVIVLSEPLTAWNAAALALILAGCVLATHRPDEPVPDGSRVANGTDPRAPII